MRWGPKGSFITPSKTSGIRFCIVGKESSGEPFQPLKRTSRRTLSLPAPRWGWELRSNVYDKNAYCSWEVPISWQGGQKNPLQHERKIHLNTLSPRTRETWIFCLFSKISKLFSSPKLNSEPFTSFLQPSAGHRAPLFKKWRLRRRALLPAVSSPSCQASQARPGIWSPSFSLHPTWHSHPATFPNWESGVYVWTRWSLSKTKLFRSF